MEGERVGRRGRGDRKGGSGWDGEFSRAYRLQWSLLYARAMTHSYMKNSCYLRSKSMTIVFYFTADTGHHILRIFTEIHISITMLPATIHLAEPATLPNNQHGVEFLDY